MKIRSVKGTKQKINKHKRRKTRRNEVGGNYSNDDDGNGNDNIDDRANSGVGVQLMKTNQVWK